MVVSTLVLLTGAVSLWLTGQVRAYALRHDVLDRPNARSSHVTPTPRGGGLAVLVAALLALAVGVAVGRIDARHALAFAPGMIVLGIVGWRDDHGGLTARLRLAAHAAAAAASLFVLGGLPDLVIGTRVLHLGPVGTVLAAIGIVWSINLFNFMDGIDGIAGSQGVLIFGVAAVLFHLRGAGSLATLSLVFAAAAAGFLYWNWPPARIFLGDVASGALGFMIAVLAVAGENDRAVPLVAFGILGGVFVADTTITLVRRMRRGDRLADAHRDHAYQRLARAWGGHRPVTLAAAATTMALAALAAAATFRSGLAGPALLVAAVLLAALAFAAERRAPM
ncbi:MAG: glycosyltransferase family 4 protein [Gemmatimonadaceae bacterium]|nr:glycosyltransferase family 4 protein [Gemmatimonadaceae bacterium]NUS31993.1 glycosyltransferase family 4 protein [Gemmatimonadaceae bacterium]